MYVLSQKYHDGLNIDDDLAKVKDKSVASEIVEVDQCTEDGCHVTSQVQGLSKTLEHLEFMELEDGIKGR